MTGMQPTREGKHDEWADHTVRPRIETPSAARSRGHNMWWGPGKCWVRHVLGCRVTHETRVHNACR